MNSRRPSYGCAAALLIAVAATGGASARAQPVAEQQTFPAERLRLSLDGEGILGVETAAIPHHLDTNIALWLGHTNDPVLSADGTASRELVSGRIGGGISGAIALWEQIEVGLDLPLIAFQWRPEGPPSNPLPSLTSVGVGDLRLAVKFRLPSWRRSSARLAGLVAVTLPSGGASSYFGDHGQTITPELVASRDWQRARIAVNLGYQMRHRTRALDLVVNDEIVARFGAGVGIGWLGTQPLDVTTALTARLAANAPHEQRRAVVEWLAAASYRVHAAFSGFAAAGVGLTDGGGTPDWRFLFGVRYAFTPGVSPATCDLASDMANPPQTPDIAANPQRLTGTHQGTAVSDDGS